MQLHTAQMEEFDSIRQFYWNLIDTMKDDAFSPRWIKGVYPSDDMFVDALEKEELYVVRDEEQDGEYVATLILNSSNNEGYEGLPWSIEVPQEHILVPHAVAVASHKQGQGVGKALMLEVLTMAKDRGCKTVRLDVHNANQPAQRLYQNVGFRFVGAKELFYPDTGWTEYLMYEYLL